MEKEEEAIVGREKILKKEKELKKTKIREHGKQTETAIRSSLQCRSLLNGGLGEWSMGHAAIKQRGNYVLTYPWDVIRWRKQGAEQYVYNCTSVTQTSQWSNDLVESTPNKPQMTIWKYIYQTAKHGGLWRGYDLKWWGELSTLLSISVLFLFFIASVFYFNN